MIKKVYKIRKLHRTIFSTFYNALQPNFTILLRAFSILYMIFWRSQFDFASCVISCFLNSTRFQICGQGFQICGQVFQIQQLINRRRLCPRLLSFACITKYVVSCSQKHLKNETVIRGFIKYFLSTSRNCKVCLLIVHG